MSALPSLRRNASWALAGNVAYAGSQALMLVVLARLTTVEVVGRFALALAIAAPVFLLAGLHLSAVQSTDVRGRFTFPEYFLLRAFASLAALAALWIFAAAGPLSPENARVLALVSLAKFVESWSQVYYGLFQRHERLELSAKSQMVKSVGSFGAFTAAVVLTGSLQVALACVAVVWAAILLGYDAPQGRRLLRSSAPDSPAFRSVLGGAFAGEGRARFGSLLLLAAPLGVYAMVDSANANLPRYFLTHHQGDAAVGYYSALAYLVVVGATVVDAVSAATRPRLARHFHHDAAAFRALLRRTLAFGVAAGALGLACAVLIGAPVLTLLYGRDYARFQDVLVVVMGAGALWYLSSILAQPLLAAGRFRTQLGIIVASASTTAAASAWLVPALGVTGAAWGFVAGMAVRFVLCGSAVAVLLRNPAPAEVLVPSFRA